ncbi:MAG: PmoA family protein [Phycisphaerae bacterium]|nr:PmoA family protein [Phycisphaerae bacterium]
MRFSPSPRIQKHLRHRSTRWLAPLAGLAGLLPTGCQAPDPSDRWTVSPSSVVFKSSATDRPLLTYRHGDVPYKPYIERLCTPAGVNILRDAPFDHLHHHGIMYAINADGVEYWAETPESGRQIVLDTRSPWTDRIDGLYRTRLTQELMYRGSREKLPSVIENRTIEAYRGEDLQASLITWQSRLRTGKLGDEIKLSGKEYYGLGMRFVPSMDKGDDFFNADGKNGFKATNNVPSRWCAYSAKAGDKLVTVAMFDHPANPRYPAVWFTMNEPFSYMTITPDLHHEGMTLKRGTPLVFRYGVALWDGRTPADQVEKLYQRWVTLANDRPSL